MDENYHLPWTEKYSPQTVDEICLPKLMKDRLISVINDKSIPNLIITGPCGNGKSSMVKIIANELYGPYYKDAVFDLGNLEDRGIGFMQNNIDKFCKTNIPYRYGDEKKYPKYKLIKFDEADNIISRVQDLISVTMDSNIDKVRFIFTCNSSSNISEGVQSKCRKWRYYPLTPDIMMPRLIEICNKENVNYNNKALEKICMISQGDLRIAINRLEQIYDKYDKITEKYVEELCTAPHTKILRDFFDAVLKKNQHEALKIIYDLREKSYSGLDITFGMIETLKSDICNDISEDIKINLMKYICNGIYNISNFTSSKIQLTGCIVDMIENV